MVDPYDSFVPAYFDGLTYNYPHNRMGSCGYVALSEVLAYYDTYLNDQILPEAYDVPSSGTETNMLNRNDSPGVERDDFYDLFSSDKDVTANQYLEACKLVADHSVHSKMIVIANEKNFYNINSQDKPCASQLSSKVAVLREFLSSVSGLTEGTDYTLNYLQAGVDGKTEQDVKELTVRELNRGYPVVLSLSSNGFGDHTLVAYDYDEDTDFISCHFSSDGYPLGTDYRNTMFTHFKSAIALHFNLEHVHSDNYQVRKDGSEESYCYDSDEIVTYRYHHNYSSSYLPYSSSLHKAYCSCGKYTLSPHVSDGSREYVGLHTYAKCALCGISIDLGSGTVLG